MVRLGIIVYKLLIKQKNVKNIRKCIENTVRKMYYRPNILADKWLDHLEVIMIIPEQNIGYRTRCCPQWTGNRITAERHVLVVDQHQTGRWYFGVKIPAEALKLRFVIVEKHISFIPMYKGDRVNTAHLILPSLGDGPKQQDHIQAL